MAGRRSEPLIPRGRKSSGISAVNIRPSLLLAGSFPGIRGCSPEGTLRSNVIRKFGPQSGRCSMPTCHPKLHKTPRPYVPPPGLPGDFRPIDSYLFVENKCNLACWYRWSFDQRIKGMTEDVARGIDRLALPCAASKTRPRLTSQLHSVHAVRAIWHNLVCC